MPTKNVHWGLSSLLFQRQKLGDPTMLMLGDSWFWYPLDNLAVELGSALRVSNHLIGVIGYNGAEASEWRDKYRKELDVAIDFYGAGLQGFFLSGGGNDLAGMRDFLRLLKDDCSSATKVDECFRPGQPEASLAVINGAYREVIAKVRARNPTVPIFVHQYDHAWPTGKGVFGPSDWLKAPMEKALVPEPLRRPLFKALIQALKVSQEKLAQQDQNVVVVPTAGVMPEDSKVKDQYWSNELHPTPRGFKLLVSQAFMPQLEARGLG